MPRLDPSSRHRSPLRAGTLALCAVALALASSCAGVTYNRETETSGNFTASGMAFTILSIDLPQRAIDIARENASDSGLPNLVIEDVTVFPNLGPFDWLLDIISLRYAHISGHWGYEE